MEPTDRTILELETWLPSLREREAAIDHRERLSLSSGDWGPIQCPLLPSAGPARSTFLARGDAFREQARLAAIAEARFAVIRPFNSRIEPDIPGLGRTEPLDPRGWGPRSRITWRVDHGAMPRAASDRPDHGMSVVPVVDPEPRRSASEGDSVRAGRLRDAGTSATAIGRGIGLRASEVRDLAAMSPGDAADWLADRRAGGSLTSEPRHGWSRDWELVGRWADLGTRNRGRGTDPTTGVETLEPDPIPASGLAALPAPNPETSPLRARAHARRLAAARERGSWTGTHAGAPVTIPLQTDGPGARAMTTRSTARLLALGRGDDRPNVPVRGAITPRVTAMPEHRARLGGSRTTTLDGRRLPRTSESVTLPDPEAGGRKVQRTTAGLFGTLTVGGVTPAAERRRSETPVVPVLRPVPASEPPAWLPVLLGILTAPTTTDHKRGRYVQSAPAPDRTRLPYKARVLSRQARAEARAEARRVAIEQARSDAAWAEARRLVAEQA